MPTASPAAAEALPHIPLTPRQDPGERGQATTTVVQMPGRQFLRAAESAPGAALCLAPPRSALTPHSAPPSIATDIEQRLPQGTTLSLIRSWAGSEGGIDRLASELPGNLPGIENILDALMVAEAGVQEWLRPESDPERILALLVALANRIGVELPDEIALEMDLRIMCEWPSGLPELAIRRVWETFKYRRMPVVGEFREAISRELAERERLHLEIGLARRRVQMLRDRKMREEARLARLKEEAACRLSARRQAGEVQVTLSR